VKFRIGGRGNPCHDGAVHRGGGSEGRLNPINVAVVDDHPAIAFAVEAAIRAETAYAESPRVPAEPAGDEALADGLDPAQSPRPLRLVGVARTVDDALQLVERPTGAGGPEVVLCDLQLEDGMDGLRVVDAARAAGRRAIVLTSFDRSSLMRAAFERGAAGFLHKGAGVGEILAAVRLVAAGGTAFSASSLDAARYAPRPPSDREIAVLRELHRGSTSDEIGGRLGISSRTVESHLRRLFDRYGVVSRTELAVLALHEGWVDAGTS
jgi:DNA-binding NarL/FixJ family response regulator